MMCNVGDPRLISSRSKNLISKNFLNFVENADLQVFSSRRQTIIARNDLEKHSIALEIPYRSISLRIDLSSTAQATEATKGQGLYSRFGDIR